MGDLVEKILPLVGNPLMMPPQPGHRLAPVAPASLLAGDRPLQATELLLRGAVERGMWDLLSRTGREKGSNAHIDPDTLPGRGKRSRRLGLAREAGIPAI